jgi:hypothetical protein
MANQQNGDRTAQQGEIRFTKQQMLAVAGFGLALIFGIFGLAHDAKLDRLERAVVAVILWLPMIAGATFLYTLQRHLKTTRLAYDGTDHDAWLRGVGVVRVLVGALVLSAAIASYILWYHSKD